RGASQLPRSASLAPRLDHELILRLHQRRGEPRLVLQAGEAVTPLVAHPVAVDVGVEARLEAVDASAMMMNVDRASTLASAAYRRRAMQIPDAHAEAEFLFGERADRADVHDI